MKRLIILTALAAMLVTGCKSRDLSTRLMSTHQRNARLMQLAGEEAGFVKDADARLTRQLNIAYQQMIRFTNADALATLAEAKRTLEAHGDELNNHARISGWVSVSQLARSAGDRAFAAPACEQAVKLLHEIESESERCQYVLGIANEVNHLEGEDAAAELLAEAGPWARQIDSIDGRRNALLAFSVALFNIDHFDPGVAVLRNEPDAAWRSDTMAMLAANDGDVAAGDAVSALRTGYDLLQQRASTPAMRDAPRKHSIIHQRQFYGQRVDFEQVFQDAQHSRSKAIQKDQEK